MRPLSPYNFNEMYKMAARGDVASLHKAISRGLNINAMDANGDTGVCVAVKRRDAKAYNTFRAAGASGSPPCRWNISHWNSFIDSAPVRAGAKWRSADYTMPVYAGAAEKSNMWRWIGGAAALGGGAALALGGGGGGSDNKPKPAIYDTTEYPISGNCPDNGVCGQCVDSAGAHYKLNSCNVGYIMAEDGKSCAQKQLEPCDTTVYTMTSCPEKAYCGDCTDSNGKYYKFNGCQSGYFVGADGQSCVETPEQVICNTAVYNLTGCPEGALCSLCTDTTGTYYKFTGCLGGYTQKPNEETCVKVTESSDSDVANDKILVVDENNKVSDGDTKIIGFSNADSPNSNLFNAKTKDALITIDAVNNTTFKNHDLVGLGPINAGSVQTVNAYDGKTGDIVIKTYYGTHSIYGIYGSGTLYNSLNGVGNIEINSQGEQLNSGTQISGMHSYNSDKYLYNAFGGTGKITIKVAADITAKGFKNEYTAADAIASADVSRLNLQSQSALFDAKLAENGRDVTLTMKSFNEVVKNKSLANFLQNNYAAQNNENLFSSLKSLENVEQINNGLNKFAGQDLFSRMAFEDFTMLRELNFDMNEQMFGGNKNEYFSISGNTAPFAFENNNGSNSRWSLTGKKSGDTTYALGFAFTDVYSNGADNQNRHADRMFNISAPVGYKLGGLKMVSTPRFGYAYGTYNRKGFNNRDYKGTLSKQMFGFMNEARLPFKAAGWTLAPSAELNMVNYRTEGAEADNLPYALRVKEQNNYSLEAGLGLHAGKQVNFDEQSALSFNLSAAVYHEFGNPYETKVTVNGMNGSFAVKDENRGANRAVLRSNFEFTRGNTVLGGALMSYFDRSLNSKASLNLKYGF